MSRLNDLIRQVGLMNEALAADLQREVATLADRRSFGLNFERHIPEVVELPARLVRRGDKVRILPPRGQMPTKADEKLWRVLRVTGRDSAKEAELVALANESDTATAAIDDLVVVAEFRDPIYPGLVSTGKVERGGDKPYHTVINAENYHALQASLFTHRGKVDCIYIDPPYNTGAKDWKYNNDYVESDDLYRHSKWLAFMERRLLLARELLNPDDSVLIVTIDEKEIHRLGLLLEQVFPSTRAQLVSIVISPLGQERTRALARVEEYAFLLFIGSAQPAAVVDDLLNEAVRRGTESAPVRWERLIRGGGDATRRRSPDLFYPVFIDPESRRIVEVGEPLPLSTSRAAVQAPRGCVAVWPLRQSGDEGRWRCSPQYLRELIGRGYARVGDYDKTRGQWTISYLGKAQIARVEAEEIETLGRSDSGELVLGAAPGRTPLVSAKTVWNRPAHRAGEYGTSLNRALIPGRSFPYPKSLYAVEDALRIGVKDKPDAIVLDFFAGSGTTAHAVMRLNRQDGGRRTSILVTNNEVAADEQRRLRREQLRPGDAGWEAWGICEHITKPRIRSAITGMTPEGEPVKGEYRFTDGFSIAEGFEENVEFFTLTYEAPLRVASHRDFERIAPLLWLRAGSRGRRIDDVSKGWDVADAYGVLADLDQVDAFVQAVKDRSDLDAAFVVTDEDRLFESVIRSLPDHVEPIRLYEAYLRNFEIEAGRGAR